MKLLHLLQTVRQRQGLGSASLRQFLVALAAVLIVVAVFALPVHAAITHNGIICDGGESNCVESWYGGNIRVYSDAGATQKFAVVGSSGDVSTDGSVTVAGDITVTGVITTDGGYIGITPVPTATRVPYFCGSQTVDAVATVIPATLTAAGITTPRAPVVSHGEAVTADSLYIDAVSDSGVVTISVWSAPETPATTPVAVNYCVSGN